MSEAYSPRSLLTAAMYALPIPALAAPALLLHGEARGLAFLALTALGAAWGVAFWPELLVVAYCFAGRYGYEARLALGDIPVCANPVLLAGVLASLPRAHRGLSAALGTRSFAAVCIFCAVLALGMGFTLGPEYGASKVARALGVVLPSTLAAITLVFARGSPGPFFAALWLLGTALDALALATYQASLDPTGRLTGLGSGPNVFARTVGIALLLAVLAAPRRTQAQDAADRLITRIAFLSIPVLLPGFLLAQSRGPVLAILVAGTIVAALHVAMDRRRALTVLAIGALALPVSAWILDQVVPVSRFDLSRDDNMGSIEERQELLRATWDLVVESPLIGLGTGGWPVAMFGIDDRRYPHNLFAEMAAEHGIPVAVAMAAFCAGALLFAVRASIRVRDPSVRGLVLMAVALALYYLLNAQISGDIIDNRLVFVLFGVMEATSLLAVIPGESAARATMWRAPPDPRLRARAEAGPSPP